MPSQDDVIGFVMIGALLAVLLFAPIFQKPPEKNVAGKTAAQTGQLIR